MHHTKYPHLLIHSIFHSDLIAYGIEGLYSSSPIRIQSFTFQLDVAIYSFL